jgi:hypothetical protein
MLLTRFPILLYTVEEVVKDEVRSGDKQEKEESLPPQWGMEESNPPQWEIEESLPPQVLSSISGNLEIHSSGLYLSLSVTTTVVDMGCVHKTVKSRELTTQMIVIKTSEAGDDSADEVDHDEVEDHVGEYEVGEPSLGADAGELELISRVHLKLTPRSTQYSGSFQRQPGDEGRHRERTRRRSRWSQRERR